MSGDGPGKVAPGEAVPLDEIILGEELTDDAATAPTPPVRTGSGPPPPVTRSAPPPPPDRGSVRPSSAPKGEKKRAKMTLRIPDDEVSRPQLPATTPTGGVPVATAARAGSQPEEAPPPPVHALPDVDPSADDTLELPADELTDRITTLDLLAAPGVDNTQEPGWTPYQPPVEPRRDEATNGNSHAAHAAHPIADSLADLESADDLASPMSEEIPIEMEEPASDRGRAEELVTRPRLPATLDSDELGDIRVEVPERTTDPEVAPEVAPEDLVSVESIPSPQHKQGGKNPAFKGSTATALMAGFEAVPIATPQATPHTPAVAHTAVQPAVVKVPSAPPPAVAPVAAPAVAPVAVAVTAPEPTPMIAQVRGPGIIVPPVGVLAPPPMTDTAANRKKTRPWWEDLFNDDYIRTMAKITDGQISQEVTFIEESLGCEAGATVLDLACGTGRHAVEMAARGYQVVGFDLSLSMLARASDEAQERGMKINFVQGDMREMTFEETFDGIFCWNTSFGFFDEEKNNAVVAKVHRALKKGGQFLLDVVNRDYIIRQGPSLAWFEGDGCICMDEMQIDFITSRLKVKRTLMMDDGRTKEIEYSIRVYALHELGKMLHDNGFRVAEVSGRTSTPGVFFGNEAPRTLILAERR